MSSMVCWFCALAKSPFIGLQNSISFMGSQILNQVTFDWVVVFFGFFCWFGQVGQLLFFRNPVWEGYPPGNSDIPPGEKSNHLESFLLRDMVVPTEGNHQPSSVLTVFCYFVPLPVWDDPIWQIFSNGLVETTNGLRRSSHPFHYLVSY